MLSFLIVFSAAVVYVGLLISSGRQDGRGNDIAKLVFALLLPFGAGHLAGDLLMQQEDINVGVSFALGEQGSGATFFHLLLVTGASIPLWILIGGYMDWVAAHGGRRPCPCGRRTPGKRAAGGTTSSSGGGRRGGMPLSDVASGGGGGDDAPFVHPCWDNAADEEAGNAGDADHEPVSENQRHNVVVRVRLLRKEFRTGGRCFGAGGVTKAVNDLSLDLVRGEIFSLLGHNGAGKTTLLNVLTSGGQTSGSVHYSLRNDAAERGARSSTSTASRGESGPSKWNVDHAPDRRKIRCNLGVCPQDNILWAECTPREHLHIFARLKGVSRPAASVDTLLRQIALPQGDGDRPVGTLSGGNQRKTALAIAMVGDPQVVFLDEPTAGMDPKSRRKVWDMLQRFKPGRSIVLCTHFMDEADLLGDRIGIMNKGRLVCSGSSLFLKHRFGRGYTLTVTRVQDGEAEEGGGDGRNGRGGGDVLDILRSKIPVATHLRSHAQEHAFSLPLDATSEFPGVLSALGDVGDALGIKDTCLSLTTLEDVFLKVGADHVDVAGIHAGGDGGHDGGHTNTKRQNDGDYAAIEGGGGAKAGSAEWRAVSGPRSTCRSVQGLCEARWLELKRSPNAIVMNMLLPITMVLLGFASPSFLKSSSFVTPPPLVLNSTLLAVPGGGDGGCSVELIQSPYSPLDLNAAVARTPEWEVRKWDSVDRINSERALINAGKHVKAFN